MFLAKLQRIAYIRGIPTEYTEKALKEGATPAGSVLGIMVRPPNREEVLIEVRLNEGDLEQLTEGALLYFESISQDTYRLSDTLYKRVPRQIPPNTINPAERYLTKGVSNSPAPTPFS
ncbi:Uncharacterised protein [uncultured archaeon]|nr:Uncharacterised protein [uncultured archaeon]